MYSIFEGLLGGFYPGKDLLPERVNFREIVHSYLRIVKLQVKLCRLLRSCCLWLFFHLIPSGHFVARCICQHVQTDSYVTQKLLLASLAVNLNVDLLRWLQSTDITESQCTEEVVNRTCEILLPTLQKKLFFYCA